MLELISVFVNGINITDSDDETLSYQVAIQ